MARPRSEEAHRAAIDATVEVLLESGVDGVTLEAVAARSGVARSTLYRHFGSKEDLVAQAASTCVIVHPTPDTGNLGDDLRLLAAQYQDAEDRQRVPDLMAMLIDAAGRDPKLRQVVDELLAERRRPVRTIVQLAQLRGEISPDLDLDAATAIVVGPFTHRRFIERQAVTPEFRDTIIEAVIAALRSTAVSPAAPR
jgi:AcrR family transcriptional regulator